MVYCSACGARAGDGDAFCGHCGTRLVVPAAAPPPVAVAPPAGPLPIKWSTDDAQPGDTSQTRPVSPVAAGSGPGGSSTPSSGYEVAPPQVWLVAVALVVLGGLLLYPLIRYGFPVLPGLFHTSLERALAAAVLAVLLLVGGFGAGMVCLGVMLVRGSPVARLLAAALGGIIGIAELVGGQPTTLGGTSHTTASFVVAAVCAAVVVLLTAPASVRRYFAARTSTPVSVAAAAAAAVVIGVDSMIFGLCLLPVGTVAGGKYVAWGALLMAVGLTLLAAARALQAGSQPARIIVTAGFVAFAALCLITSDGHLTIASVVAVGLALAVLGMLWIDPAAQQFYTAATRPVHTGRRPIGLIVTACVAAIATVWAATAAGGTPTFDDPAAGTTSTSDPTYAYPTPTGSTYVASGADAYASVDQLLTAMESGQSTTTLVCPNGTADSLTVQNYSIGQVTPDTTGRFQVTATVTLADGSADEVTYTVDSNPSGGACISASTETPDTPPTPTDSPSDSPSAAAAPTDVPSVPAGTDPVPTDAAVPAVPANPGVAPYTQAGVIPRTPGGIVEYQPTGLDPDQTAAVQSVIGFLTAINQQNFPTAWRRSTELLSAATPSPAFTTGYATTRFYQVAFGQPQTLAGDLIVIPARFVSRQNPAAQGNPAGVTACSYWPQYLFLMVKINGDWLNDVAASYADRPELAALKRPDADQNNTPVVDPLAQRVTC